MTHWRLLYMKGNKDRMEKPIIIGKNLNKHFWWAFSVSFVLCFFMLCSHYSALFSAHNGLTLFTNYTISPIIIPTIEGNPVFDNKNRVKQVDHSLVTDQNRTKPVSKQGLDSCTGQYIYVHDLPSRFNTDILKNCSSLIKWFDMCKSISNMGLGPLAKNSNGILQNGNWYSTNQFVLEIIFHNRMKQYKCLTNNSKLASAIYVPFYAGLDVGRYLWGGFNTSVRDSAPLDLFKWLGEKPEWKYMWGRDHFFIGGRITWDFRRQMENDSSWGNKLMSMPEAKNMTMLVIESSPWSSNDFAIPYPTYFHPSTDKEVFQWQNRVRRQKRKYLFSFVGAPRPNLTDSIRGKIINQCLSSRRKCKLLDCNKNNCHEPLQVMKMFQTSIFCLQPPGDSYTRRSTFDSILAGCIPVFFHPGSAYIQYIWHLPKNYSKYSMFIPEDGIRDRKANIEKILHGISENEVLAMREEVIRLIPGVIYADPKSRLESVEDAFDIAVKGVVERVGRIRREMKEGRSSSFNFPEENSWKYYLFGSMGEHKWDYFFTKSKNPKSSMA